MIVLALDPGITTGYAVVDLVDHTGAGRGARASTLLAVGSLPFHTALLGLDRLAAGAYSGHAHDTAAAVVVEDGAGLPVYSRFSGVTGRRRDALARSVGETDARARTLADVARAIGFPVVTIPPAGGKWDAAELLAATGHAGKTNQHARDAVRAALSTQARAQLAALPTAP